MRIAIVTDVPVGYFRVKADPERAVEQAHVPWTLVRATQFHEIVDTTLARAGRWRELPVHPVRLQTVAADDVAKAVAERRPRRAPRGGVLTAERPDVRGTTSFATWLTAEQR